MAYDSVESVKKLNIGMPDNTAINGLQASLESPSVPNFAQKTDKSNANPSMNRNMPKSIEATAPPVKPSTLARTVKVMNNEQYDGEIKKINNSYMAYALGGLNINNNKELMDDNRFLT